MWRDLVKRHVTPCRQTTAAGERPVLVYALIAWKRDAKLKKATRRRTTAGRRELPLRGAATICGALDLVQSGKPGIPDRFPALPERQFATCPDLRSEQCADPERALGNSRPSRQTAGGRERTVNRGQGWLGMWYQPIAQAWDGEVAGFQL